MGSRGDDTANSPRGVTWQAIGQAGMHALWGAIALYISWQWATNQSTQAQLGAGKESLAALQERLSAKIAESRLSQVEGDREVERALKELQATLTGIQESRFKPQDGVALESRCRTYAENLVLDLRKRVDALENRCDDLSKKGTR